MPTTQVSNGLSPLSETTPESSPGPSPKRHCLQGPPPYGAVEAAPIGGLAARACEKCRASKRKCDKKLPFCDRCKRLNAKCHYVQDLSNNVIPAGAQFVILQPHAYPHPRSLAHDALFRAPEPLDGISASQILSLVSAGPGPGAPGFPPAAATIDWRAAVNAYFLCVHSWFAVVHPTLFERQVAALVGLLESPPPSETVGSLANASLNLNANLNGHGNVNVDINAGANGITNANGHVDYSLAPPNPNPIANTDPSLNHNANANANANANVSHADDWRAKCVALLIVAMYLNTRMRVTDAGPQPIIDEVYRTAKRVLAWLLLSSVGDPEPGVELVQAGTLIALYEYGHGHAVTAYRTLSQVVVTARIMGVKPGQLADGNGSGSGGGDTVMLSVEEEQTGCLWWAMFILEQFIHQDEEAKNLPFLLESPTRNTLLPESPPMTPPPSSTGTGFPASPPHPHLTAPRRLSADVLVGTEKFGGFQLSAKTACLFHRAIRIDKERDERPGKMPLVASYAELDREIRETTLTLLGETLDWESTLDCFAMLVSALFTLYLPYLPILEHSLGANSPQALLASSEEVSTALAALRFACKMSTDISCKLNADFEAAPRSPALLCAPAGATCYHVITAYASLRRIFPEESGECEANIAEKFESLQLFSYRWGIAETMMSRLEKKLSLDRNQYLQNSRLTPPSHASCLNFGRR